ncbi:helix-turn-helix domain-containing protein [Psychrobacillus sp. NPDC093180]|uniref:helix-turn-helix domain-containing protein n=1 Tax=Psychrobacillus sp. NPDC093180 TaxID=3364489 RepID=UPI0037F5CB1B
MKDVGKKIRELRIQKGYTLKDIADKTNLTSSFLSQLERSKTSVTLQSLSKISKALGVTQSYFFTQQEKQEENKQITRHKTHLDVEIHGTNFIYKTLSGNLHNQLFEPMLVILLPAEKQIHQPSTHEGQEFVYILEGTLTVMIEDSITALEAGDSFHIESTTPHTWYNTTSKIVKLLYVSSNSY